MRDQIESANFPQENLSGKTSGENFLTEVTKNITKVTDKLSPAKQQLVDRLRTTTKKAALSLACASLLVQVGCGNATEPTAMPSDKTEDIHPNSPAPASDFDFVDSRVENQDTEIIAFSGARVIFDKINKIPLKIIDYFGDETDFDLQKVLALQQQAKDTHEPQFLAISADSYPKFPDPNSSKYLPSVDHPILKDLPEDVLTDEELKQKGISIIQGDKIQLHIRKDAFGPTGPLKLYNGKNGRDMLIVLVEGGRVANQYLKDPKYDSVRGFIEPQKIDPDEFRQNKISELEKKVDKLKQKALEIQIAATNEPNIKKELLKSIDKSIITVKANHWRYTILPPSELRKISGDEGAFIGEYFEPTDERGGMIILAVGGEPEVDQIVWGFDSMGNFIYSHNDPDTPGNAITPVQAFINPEDYPIDPLAKPNDPTSYPYSTATGTPGFSLHHENMHDQLINRRGIKNIKPNKSEYDTDMAAMEQIRFAWNKWKKSEYTDNTGYSFVFNLPNGEGYILSKDPSRSLSHF